MSDTRNDAELLSQEIVYDGEAYDRDGLEVMITGYQGKHETDLASLSELRRAHDEIAAEMTKDLAESKSAWEYVRDMMANDFHSNIKGLLEKIPIISELMPDRPLAELLREKIQIAETRTKQVGHFLGTIERSVSDLQADVARLNKKVVVAAQNEEKAAIRVLELKDRETELQAEIETAGDERSAAHREASAEVAAIRQAIWETGAKLRLYSNAEDRIAAIVAMNSNFLQILTNLHGNMQTLYEAGMEVLDELRGNLSGLSTAAEASELSAQMQQAMQSLKTSVNKVAVLASSTSLYLTQNIERLTSDMKVYDEATAALVESNLSAEREIQEQRINDTIALAEKEYGLFKRAREGKDSDG